MTPRQLAAWAREDEQDRRRELADLASAMRAAFADDPKYISALVEQLRADIE